MMDRIIQGGIPDPQLLFLGIGDHECDSAPLQIGQFESSDELLDKWLTGLWLEGGGGGNEGESYMLAWYFAWKHTVIDCFAKRGQKGHLFTVGDEPVLPELPKSAIDRIMGQGQHETISTMELIDKAAETYNVYHLHVRTGHSGRRQEVMDGWKQMLGDRLIIVEHHRDISKTIADIVGTAEGGAVIEVPPDSAQTVEPEAESATEEVL